MYRSPTIPTLLTVLMVLAVCPRPALAHYRPGTGRWLERDPKGYHDSQDLYETSASSPALLLDASGGDVGWAKRKRIEHIPHVPKHRFDFEPPEMRSVPDNNPYGDQCRKTVYVHLAEDFDSKMAKHWSSTIHGGLHVSIDPANESWSCLLTDTLAQLGDCCVASVQITGHGGPGSLGLKGSVGITDLKNPSSGVRAFFDGLSERRCLNAAGEAQILACKQAQGPAGKLFMRELAELLHMRVRGWDDWYAVFPYGHEYLVHPDGRVEYVRNCGPYEGSFVQFVAQSRNKSVAIRKFDKEAKKETAVEKKESLSQGCSGGCIGSR